MVYKKEHRSYMDVELNAQKTTLAKSIDKEYRLKNPCDDLRCYEIIDDISQKKTDKEECSFKEPQSPQMD